MKACPFCAEEIQDAAIVCKHCGRDLPTTQVVSQIVPKKPIGLFKTFVYSVGILIALFVVASLVANLGSSSSPEFTSDHREAALEKLRSRALTEPTHMFRDTIGFIVADYELSDEYARRLAIPMKSFGEMRLLAVREALLPFGFKDFRVNVNGTPPGSGLVKRYGSSRYIDGGNVEWLTP